MTEWTKETKVNLSFENGILKAHSPLGRNHWELKASSLVLIAEYTTNEGPWVDDYFLVFIAVQNRQPLICQVTFYADGIEKSLHALGEALDANLYLGLTASTHWKSNVIWPATLAGEPYYEFANVSPTTIISKANQILLGPTQSYCIAEGVRRYLSEQPHA